MINPGTEAMQQLLAYNKSLTGLGSKDWTALYPALTEHSLTKGAYLLQSGDICNALFFISKGYCRAFTDKDGREINTGFFFENDIATNINSFARGEKSAFSIRACEALTFIRFNKEKLMTASREDPDIELLGRKCLQRIATRQELHAAMYQLMTAGERYEYLERHQPELLQRVSLSQLSSYLGIARETLSRIRKRRS